MITWCRSSAPCTNPFEIYSAVMDFLAQEDDVTMTGKLVEQLRTNMERTVMQNSTQQILTMLNKLVLDVKDFNVRYAGRSRVPRTLAIEEGREASKKSSLKIWPFSFYVPSSSFCRYHSKYTVAVGIFFPKTEETKT